MSEPNGVDIFLVAKEMLWQTYVSSCCTEPGMILLNQWILEAVVHNELLSSVSSKIGVLYDVEHILRNLWDAYNGGIYLIGSWHNFFSPIDWQELCS